MNTSKLDRYSLKHYTRLIIAFFLSLMILSVLQYTILYFKGVSEGIFSWSLFISITHQLGYASIIAVVLTLPFNFWENYRPK